MGHMAFPPKPFDMQGLYGANTRPFVQFLYTDEQIDDWAGGFLDRDAAAGFGVIVLFGQDLYDSMVRCKAIEDAHPCLQSSNHWGFEFRSPAKIRNFITLAHSKGYKVITYMYDPGNSYVWKSQPINRTLEWMRLFQKQYALDGWYFDGMYAGPFMATYDFVKQVRKDIGDNGIIFAHNSWESLGSVLQSFGDSATRTSGFQAVYANAYINYNLAGETGPLAAITSVDDPYLRFWSSGYGIAQTWGSHKLSVYSQGVLEDPMQRKMAELRGASRRSTSSSNYHAWNNSFKPAYEIMKRNYLGQ